MFGPPAFIHETAIVDPRATVGHSTKIWANVQVRENAKIGNKCVISKDVYVDHGVQIGDECKIQNGVSVFSGVTIGDKVFIGPHVSFTNDKVPRAFSLSWRVIPTEVHRGASIGANATIICGVVIGDYSMIAAGAVVTKDVPPFTLVAGNPARFIAKIDISGNRVGE